MKPLEPHPHPHWSLDCTRKRKCFSAECSWFAWNYSPIFIAHPFIQFFYINLSYFCYSAHWNFEIKSRTKICSSFRLVNQLIWVPTEQSIFSKKCLEGTGHNSRWRRGGWSILQDKYLTSDHKPRLIDKLVSSFSPSLFPAIHEVLSYLEIGNAKPCTLYTTRDCTLQAATLVSFLFMSWDYHCFKVTFVYKSVPFFTHFWLHGQFTKRDIFKVEMSISV